MAVPTPLFALGACRPTSTRKRSPARSDSTLCFEPEWWRACRFGVRYRWDVRVRLSSHWLIHVRLFTVPMSVYRNWFSIKILDKKFVKYEFLLWKSKKKMKNTKQFCYTVMRFARVRPPTRIFYNIQIRFVAYSHKLGPLNLRFVNLNTGKSFWNRRGSFDIT